MTCEDGRMLIERARAGDRPAREELVEHYRQRLASVVPARIFKHGLRRHLEVEDVIDETFGRAFEGLDRFEWRSDDSFSRWLSGIAERVILEAVRRQRRRTTWKLPGDVAASGTTPSRALRREERLARLQGALANLSPEHREVIVLARIDGLRTQEIAERMGRSPDAVKKLLSRALKDLKHAFGETESFRLPDRGLEVDHGPER